MEHKNTYDNNTQTAETFRPLSIQEPDREAMERCRLRWNRIAKPLYGLGRLEEAIVQMAGIQRTSNVSLDKKALIVMCADNGVVEEGISQTDSSVTGVVTDNFAEGKTSACLMAKRAGVDVFPVDIGVSRETKVFTDKVAFGTRNMAKEPAMTRAHALEAIAVGVRAARRCKEAGYDILLTGEMGIGNTTTSSAAVCVLLNADPAKMTGRGAGLSKEGLRRKQDVIRQAIKLHSPDRNDPVDVLAKVGGLDLAGLAGVFLGGASLGLPVVMDGFISAAAALIAARLQPEVSAYILPSHCSGEQGMRRILQALHKEPYLDCGMKLGEGTGAAAAMPLFDMALDVYRHMPDFDGICIEAYHPFED